jgi:ferredoxin
MQTTAESSQGSGFGIYFVSDECDGCAYCASVAPENFDYNKETNSYFVCKQPSDVNEYELVSEAAEDCPIDAIQRQEAVAQ